MVTRWLVRQFILFSVYEISKVCSPWEPPEEKGFCARRPCHFCQCISSFFLKFVLGIVRTNLYFYGLELPPLWFCFVCYQFKVFRVAGFSRVTTWPHFSFFLSVWLCLMIGGAVLENLEFAGWGRSFRASETRPGVPPLLLLLETPSRRGTVEVMYLSR